MVRRHSVMIVERGSHADLLTTNGRYAEMWLLQQAEEAEAELQAAAE